MVNVCCPVLIVARTYSPLHLVPTSHRSLSKATYPAESTLRITWKRPAVRGNRWVWKSGIKRRNSAVSLGTGIPERVWAGV